MTNKYFFPVLALLILLDLLFSFNFIVKKTNIQIPNLPSKEYKNNSKTLEKEFNPQVLTLEKIFQKDHSWTATLSAQKTKVLIATGDVIPARSVNFRTVTSKNFVWPFEKTMGFLRKSDIVFSNLESPLVDNCPLTNTGMIFCGDKRNLDGLLYSGINVVSLANNHSANYGLDGVNSTIQTLNNAGILVTGDKPNLAIKEVRGTSFAFLGFNDIEKTELVSSVNEDKIKSEIANARKKADIVIVTFHWGDEYTNQPNKRQHELARLAIDSGADLIVGNHPHWIQPVEIYKDKLIMYAHGNFVFDQMWSEKTKLGVVGKYTFYDKKLVDVEYFPIKIEDFGQPYFLEGIEKEAILKNLEIESYKLKGNK